MRAEGEAPPPPPRAAPTRKSRAAAAKAERSVPPLSHGMSAPPRRVRLRPWLEAQVSSRRFPGLRWLDPGRRRFAIPWRHATRGPSEPPEQHSIFKAWAQETGRFREGQDEPDPAKWKANLRCALNKSRDFRLLFDGTKAAPLRPYKVYELCDRPPRGTDGGPEDDYDYAEEEEDVNQLQMTALSISDTHHGGDLLPPFSSGCPMGPFMPPPLAAELGSTHGTPVELGGAHGSPKLPPLEPPPACPLEAPLEDPIPNLLISPHTLPLTDLELQFQYRGRQACVLTVSNAQGCRLFHGSLEPSAAQEELFGPPALEQVRFPATDAIPNEKQRFYTHQLLDALDRGLILELQGQDLFATRLCQCKVFWTGPCATRRAGPNPIEREKKTKLFSLEGFLNGLILFQKGQTTTPPPFEIFLCFGEEWPDHKPKEKKLITVQVVPVAARLLLEMFSGELSWSADSIPLHISHPDLKDKMVEQFKELHKLWQSQQRLPPPAPVVAQAESGPTAGTWMLPQ